MERGDGLRKKPSVFGGLNHAMNEWAAARRIYVTGCGGGGRLHRCCAGAATAGGCAGDGAVWRYMSILLPRSSLWVELLYFYQISRHQVKLFLYGITWQDTSMIILLIVGVLRQMNGLHYTPFRTELHYHS